MPPLVHLVLAREAYENARNEVRLKVNTQEFDPLLNELSSNFSAALFSRNSEDAQSGYARSYSLGNLLVHTINPGVHPLEYIRSCSYFAHVCYSLDRGAAGLYWAKKGKRIAQNYPKLELKVVGDREKLDRLHFLISRDVALGYHNLKIPKDALSNYDYAQSLVNDKKSLSDIGRNRLLALSNLPRFTLSEAEGLAFRSQDHFEAEGDEISYYLANDALSRAYLAYGGNRNRQKAMALLELTTQQMDGISSSGHIHRIVPRITAAKALWEIEDKENWGKTVREAWIIADSVGLGYQQRKIVEEFGSALIDVLEPSSLDAWLNT